LVSAVSGYSVSPDFFLFSLSDFTSFLELTAIIFDLLNRTTDLFLIGADETVPLL
jgi:hypothetical protein